MGRGMTFGKKWQNSDDVPSLIASSALPERGGKTPGLSALHPAGPQSSAAPGGRRRAEEEMRAELEELELEPQRHLSSLNAAGNS